MAPFLLWLKDNWFPLLQGIGIIAGLFFTAASIRRDTKARKIGDLLALTQQHRELWSEVHRRPDLARIFDADLDLIGFPITAVEEKFLLLVLVHFTTGWQLARQGSMLSLDVLATDVRWFFNLPLPRAVWEQTKAIRDPKFVKFVEKSLHDTRVVTRESKN